MTGLPSTGAISSPQADDDFFGKWTSWTDDDQYLSWRLDIIGPYEELRPTVTISGRTSFTNNTAEGGGGKKQVIAPSVNTGDEVRTCVHDSHDS